MKKRTLEILYLLGILLFGIVDGSLFINQYYWLSAILSVAIVTVLITGALLNTHSYDEVTDQDDDEDSQTYY